MSEPFRKNRLVYELDLWKTIDPSIIAGITTRQSGFSKKPFSSLNMGFHVEDNKQHVLLNREKVSRMLNFPLDQWIGTEQVHESKIAKVTKEHAGLGARDLDSAIRGTDGIYTSEHGVLLTSLYADCVPLYFFAPRLKLIGLAHAGWRGTVDLIGPKMIRTWVTEEHIEAKEIHVAIGPSIGQCCYEVDSLVIRKVDEALGGVLPKPYKQTDENTYKLSLQETNRLLLIHEGVLAENIAVTSYCTSCNNDVFFSHRAESGRTGRIMSYVGLF
ncbi:peptidoglycan editing factor PgeF [Fictibacillus gelatini]|uniref:peptidoglycan editing factor PgeF n=1 Tax=Fictibacillus gelatini TaxID=225985 RepID=UPI0003FC49FA|nr:peptidoglycan editing factor PgeF [Fictibacillus gelatini]